MKFSPRTQSASTVSSLAAAAIDSPNCPCKDEILRDGVEITLNDRYVLPGEVINLSIECDKVLTDFQWEIPGIIFKEYNASVNSARMVGVSDEAKKEQSIEFCWADTGEPREVIVRFKADKIRCKKRVTFYVKKPICTFTAIQGQTQMLGSGTIVKLWTSVYPTVAGISFRGQVEMPQKPSPLPPFPTGEWQFVQTVFIRIAARPVNPANPLHNITSSSAFTNLCDEFYPYPSLPDEPAPPYAADGSVRSTNDSPQYALNASNFRKLKTFNFDDFNMYIMFRPSGGNWVPLKVIDWGWAFCVSATQQGNNFVWSLHGPDQYNDAAVEVTRHPLWEGHVTRPLLINQNLVRSLTYCGG